MAAQTIPDMRDAEMGGAPALAERPVVVPEGSERLDVMKARRPRSSRSRSRM